jgi:hypothetical protein
MTSKIIHGLSVDDVTRTGVRCLAPDELESVSGGYTGKCGNCPCDPNPPQTTGPPPCPPVCP